MEWKDNKYAVNKQIILKDKLIDFSFPLIMGIVNVTPDSFYQGSRTFVKEAVLDRVEALVKEGVDIIDVGGISTRSGADLLTEEEELERVIPVLQEIRKNFPDLPISIDTFRAKVARKAVENGADIVNDVYGGDYDEEMYATVRDLDVPYVLMHCRGTAVDMQKNCNYEDVVQEVFFELSEKLQKARHEGVKEIILDLGFGFAKNVAQNYILLQNLNYFHLLECPILLGISRKSMIYKLLGKTPEESLIGTTVLNTIGLLSGCSIIRVHDVQEAVELRKLVTFYKENN